MRKPQTDLGRAVVNRLLREHATIAEAVLLGSCPDFAAYRFHAGQLEGLQMAARLVVEAEHLEDEEQDT